MKANVQFMLISFLICALLTACGPSQADQDATITQLAANVFSTQTAQAPLATSTPEPSNTPTVTHTATLMPTATMDPKVVAQMTQAVKQTEAAAVAQKTRAAERTAQAISAQETQQAEDALWAQLAQDGTITYRKGKLHSVDDFEESWAQRNWYQWWMFKFKMSDFVISSHIEWDSPEDSARGQGGCGFAIRIKDSNNHLVIFVTPDNRAMLGQMSPQGFNFPDFHWENPDVAGYSAITPPNSGSTEFLVVAEKEFITAYVNGEKLYQWYVALTSSGDIGYTILSGTNKDFGTYCKFTNTRVWELEE